MKLHHTNNGASKFWSVDVVGTDATVQFGPTGTPGQSTTKRFPTVAEANAFATRKIEEKLSGGYTAHDSEADAPAKAAAALPSLADDDKETPLPGAQPALIQILKAFTKFNETLSNYSPAAGRKLHGDLSAATMGRFVDGERSLAAMMEGPLAPLMADSEVAVPLEDVRALLALLDLFREPGFSSDLPAMMSLKFAMSIKSTVALYGVKLGDLVASFDAPPPPVAAPRKKFSSQVSLTAFKSLSPSERAQVLYHAETSGYDVKPLTDPPPSILGQANVDAVFAFLREAAKTNSVELAKDFPDAFSIGRPAIREVVAVKTRGSLLGYQVLADINVQPSDDDFTSSHSFDSSGALLESVLDETTLDEIEDDDDD